jgi:hypothetical protein
MGVDKSRANYPLQVGLYLLPAKLTYYSIADADVSLLRQEIIAIDDCALQENLAPFRHSLENRPAIYLASCYLNMEWL